MTDLTDLDLAVGDTVRYQRKPGAHWTLMRVQGVEKDGSIRLVGDNGIRAIMPDRLERKAHGPKGGVLWLPLTGQDRHD